MVSKYFLLERSTESVWRIRVAIQVDTSNEENERKGNSDASIGEISRQRRRSKFIQFWPTLVAISSVLTNSVFLSSGLFLSSNLFQSRLLAHQLPPWQQGQQPTQKKAPTLAPKTWCKILQENQEVTLQAGTKDAASVLYILCAYSLINSLFDCHYLFDLFCVLVLEAQIFQSCARVDFPDLA